MASLREVLKMKITQDKQFNPVTIVIESEIELAQLCIACNKQIKHFRHNLVCSKINTYLFDNNIMTINKAKNIFNNV